MSHDDILAPRYHHCQTQTAGIVTVLPWLRGMYMLMERRSGRYRSNDGSLSDEVFDNQLYPSGTRPFSGFTCIPYLDTRLPSQLLEILKRDGLVITKMLDAEHAAALKALVTSFEGDGDVQARVSHLVRRDSAFLTVALHPVLLAILRRYIAAPVRCATFSSNTMLPEGAGSGLGWHVDFPYSHLHEPWQVDPPLGVQVLTALDEFTSENGGTLFRRNSHTRRRWPTYEEFAIPGPHGNSQCEQLGRRIAPSHPSIRAFHPLSAGDVVITHAAWWHRQMANVSLTSRTALLANYVPRTRSPKDDMGDEFARVCKEDMRDRDRCVFAELWM